MSLFARLVLAVAVLLIAAPAWADRVALLPSRGAADAGARTALDADLARALSGAKHVAVPSNELANALKTIADGAADTPEEYRSVGTATKADWTLVASMDDTGPTARVELTACLVSNGRVESVARDVDKPRSVAELQEMIGVLLRPEGISAGALPWERPLSAKPPPPTAQVAPPKPAEPWDGKLHLAYPAGETAVWPPYTAGHRGFASAVLGFDAAVGRPQGAAGAAAGLSGALRAGFAPLDLGLEAFGELGGNLAGPRALWLAAGGRWMFTPLVRQDVDGQRRGFPLHVGPEVLVGAFVRLATGDVTGPNGMVYTSSTAVNAMLGAALDAAVSFTPTFQLEADLGNLRWIPTGDGSIVLIGATLAATIRF